MENNRRILVVNDDGIEAQGIKHLVKMAMELGEVWVVAPAAQCSAMSQRITVNASLEVRKVDFLIEGVDTSGVHAYSVSGTPADCVKIGVLDILPAKPDFVFSGVNLGYNAGFDIVYSGTLGAAMEGIMLGIPALAFSCEGNISSDGRYNFDVTDKYMPDIARELMEKPLPKNQVWNVNFPCCPLEELKGIKYGCIPAKRQFYSDHYDKTEISADSYLLHADGIPSTEGREGTDIGAVTAKYISVGTVTNMIL